MLQKLMDRAIKERVIGAIVLVVIAVLVVPVFLDGPSEQAEMITEPVTLPGQNGQPRTRKTIVLERDRDQPVPVSAREIESRQAAGPADGDASAARDEPDHADQPGDTVVADRKAADQAESADAAAAPPEPVDAPDEIPEPASTAREEQATAAAPADDETGTESATGMWAVQLGSFSNRDNAERLAKTLRERGYAAFLSQLQTGKGELNRVRVGPQKDRDSAEAIAAKLSADGLKGQVVPHP